MGITKRLSKNKILIKYYRESLSESIAKNKELNKENESLRIKNVLYDWKIEEMEKGKRLEIINNKTAILIQIDPEPDRSIIDHEQSVDFYLFKLLKPERAVLSQQEGRIHASKHKEHIYIHDILAKQEDEGNGSLLLKQLIDYASSQPEIKYINGGLSSIDEKNKSKLIYFYEKHGFKILDSTKPGWWGSVRKDITEPLI